MSCKSILSKNTENTQKNAKKLLKTERILDIKCQLKRAQLLLLACQGCDSPSYSSQLRHCRLDGTQLVVSVGLGWSRHTCISTGFMYYRDQFIFKIVSVIESH